MYSAQGIFTSKVYSCHLHLEWDPGAPPKGTIVQTTDSSDLFCLVSYLVFWNILYLLLCLSSLSLLGSYAFRFIRIIAWSILVPMVRLSASESEQGGCPRWLSILLIGIWVVVSNVELLQMVPLWAFCFLYCIYTIGTHFDRCILYQEKNNWVLGMHVFSKSVLADLTPGEWEYSPSLVGR